METLIKTPFISNLLSGSTINPNTWAELQQDFVNQVITLSVKRVNENNIPVYWILHFTLLQLELLQENKELDVTVNNYLSKGLDIIRTALKWEKMNVKVCRNPIHEIKNEKSERKHSADLQWSGKVTELVELAYALHSAGCLNGGTIELNRIINFLGKVFQVEIKNPNQIYQTFKFRVDSRTLFLDELVKQLNRRMENDENRQSQRR